MPETAVAEPPSESTVKSGNKPTFKRKMGNISIAVFEDEVSSKTGDIFTAHKIAIQKSWKKNDGGFDERTVYLDRNDIMKVVAGLNEAFLATYDQDGA